MAVGHARLQSCLQGSASNASFDNRLFLEPQFRLVTVTHPTGDNLKTLANGASHFQESAVYDPINGGGWVIFCHDISQIIKKKQRKHHTSIFTLF